MRKEDKLFCISLHLLRRYDESEVVEKQELEFELVELCLRETSDLRIPRISVEYIAEKFTGDCDASNDKSMDVIRVDNKRAPRSLGGEARHAVKIHEEG